jgi:hypothetical protein
MSVICARGYAARKARSAGTAQADRPGIGREGLRYAASRVKEDAAQDLVLALPYAQTARTLIGQTCTAVSEVEPLSQTIRPSMRRIQVQASPSGTVRRWRAKWKQDTARLVDCPEAFGCPEVSVQPGTNWRPRYSMTPSRTDQTRTRMPIRRTASWQPQIHDMGGNIRLPGP